MASNGVPGNDGFALKKRKAVGASARAKLDVHGEEELPLPLSAIKKSKRAAASRHESEFVSVEVGLRELQKRMASSSTTPEKTQKRSSKQILLVKETSKKVPAGRAKIPIAAVENGDEEPTAANSKRRAAARATPTLDATAAVIAVAVPSESETPVKAARRSATPTKRSAAVAAENVPKRAVKPKTTPAKSVLDTLAQARAAAMQQQQERIQQRIQGLTGAAVPRVSEPTTRLSPVLKSHETPPPKAPVVKAAPLSAAEPKQHAELSSLVAEAKKQVAVPSPSPSPVIEHGEHVTPSLPAVLPSPRIDPAKPTPSSAAVGMPLQASHEPSPSRADIASTQETTASQGFIEEDDFDEDLAFLQALEEVESKLQTPTKPPRPTASPAAVTPSASTGGAEPPSLQSPSAIPIVESAGSAPREQTLQLSEALQSNSVTARSPPAAMTNPPSSPPVTVPAPVAGDVTAHQRDSPPRTPTVQAPTQVTTPPLPPPASPALVPPRAPAPTPAPAVSLQATAAPAIPPEIWAEYERLKRENEALRRSNELLQAGTSAISTPPSPIVGQPAAPVLASEVGEPSNASSPNLHVNNVATLSPVKQDIPNAPTDEGAIEEPEQNDVVTPASISDAAPAAVSSVVADATTERDGGSDAEVQEEPMDVEVGGDVDAAIDLAHDEKHAGDDNGEEEVDLSQPVETHQSTIDRGNYAQYRAQSSDEDEDLDEDTNAYTHVRPATSKPVRSGNAASNHPPKRRECLQDNSQGVSQSRNRAAQAPARQAQRLVVMDDSETESDEGQQHRRRRAAAVPDSSSSSSSEDSDDDNDGGSKSGSSVLDAALRAATGKAPLKSAPKTMKAAPATALESLNEKAIDLTSTTPAPAISTKRMTKKRRATTLSVKDKSTLLWPSLDDFYDFVLDLTPRRVLLSDPLHLQLLRAYEKARARLPTQYPGLAQYCDVQSEAILEELLSSVRNAEEMSLHNSSRSRLWLTSISPCSNTSSHTSTVMNAALASSSASSSLNPNVIFMESGFSGTSAAGKSDYIVTFQDNRAGANQKSALSDFISGDLLAMRSPAWRDHDIYAFGIVLCSSVVAVGGSASSGSGGSGSSSNQDQLCVLLRAPTATEDDPDAASRFASIMEMCLVNQRSTQWCWSLDQVHNLTTSAREFQAIKSVRLLKSETKEMIMSGIIPEIVKTEQSQIVEPRKKLTRGLYEELEGKYNASQLQAILGSISDESAISIIQGPPGTGKTKTILGVLSALLDGAALSSTRQAHVKSRIRIGASLQENSSKSSSSSKGNDQKSVAQSTIRVLVAAPSNAAVDELIVRLLGEGVYDARQGKSYRPRIVRVGRPESLQQSRPSSSDRSQDQDILKKKKWRKYASEVEEILLENLVNKHKSSFPTAKQARQSIIQNAQIVFCTLSGAGSVAMCELQAQHFDALVIDEAAQAVEASLLIPFKFQPSRIVLVGDHRQLPATVISKRLIDLGYDRSLFQRLVENGSRVFMLLQQYRMHPEISWFPSTYFYNGKLVEAPQMKEWTARKYHRETFFRPFVFYDVLSGKQSQVNGSKSLRNVSEIECILVLLTRLVVEQFPELEWRRKIGIIAPYKQQIYELRNELQKWEKKYDKKLDIEVNTVDGFQGREKEVIIYSCVRTSRTGQNRSNRQTNGQSIEAFWADERRMNVAITRAKSSLWIIGNSTLLQQSAAWRALITHAKDSRRYMLEEDLSGKKRRDSDSDSDADRRQSQARSRDRSQSQAKSSERSRSQARSRDRSKGRERARSRSRSRSRPRAQERDARDRRR